MAIACVLSTWMPDDAAARPIGIEPGHPAGLESAAPSLFPVVGEFEYGDGFGAGRGHQGVDLLARCGLPVIAARAGVVQWFENHASGGLYIVVDSDDDGEDLVYMHLRRVYAHEGAHVEAGETIGLVGDTGDATTCHLHFEIWSPPGWYEGGAAINSKPYLRDLEGAGT